MQNKVDEAEKKYKQVQEQLERITQQVQELQPKCAELKTESQKRNNLLKSSEVRVECTNRSIGGFLTVGSFTFYKYLMILCSKSEA